MDAKQPSGALIAPSALVHPSARLGRGTRVWAFAQIAEHAVIGRDCVIANGAYIDRHVKIGHRVRIHNKALLYHGVVLEDDVFVGPGACFTNDAWPKSGLTRRLRGISWRVKRGASIGANATVLPDVTIGRGAMVGAGALVSRNVPDRALVYGHPARIEGLVCDCGRVIKKKDFPAGRAKISCKACGRKYKNL